MQNTQQPILIETLKKNLIIAINTSQEDALNWLKNHPIFDVNVALNMSGRSILHFAISAGYAELITYLLNDRKANIENTDLDGHTAWLWAVHCGQWAIAELLQTKFCKIDICNNYGCNGVHLALRHASSLEEFQKFLKLLTEEQQQLLFLVDDREKKTLFHYAAFAAHPDVIKSLCENKWLIEKIDAENNYGYTPLFNATNYKRIDSIFIFLHYGANPCTINQHGESPLHLIREMAEEKLALHMLHICIEKLKLENEDAKKILYLGQMLSENTLFFLKENNQPSAVSRLEKCEAEIYKWLKSLEPHFSHPAKVTATQLHFMIWLLLESSDILLMKAKLAPSLKAAHFSDALKRAASAVRLCEQSKTAVPDWLQQRCEAQSWRVLNMLWRSEQNSEPPDFRKIICWLAEQRQLLKKHREELYQKVSKFSFLSFEEHRKLSTEQLPIHQLLKQNQVFFIELAKKLYLQTQTFFPDQKPPCEFLIAGLGSMGKIEISPYSDFEHMILVKFLNDDVKNYFSLMARWLERSFILLGETEDLFHQREGSLSLNHAGFHFDRNGGYCEQRSELMNTPILLARELTKNDGELIAQSALGSAVAILGDSKLLDEYQQAAKQQFAVNTNNNFFFNKEFLHQKRGLNRLERNCNDFDSGKQNAKKVKEDKREFNIKAELLRLVSQVVADLCGYYNLWPESADTWSRLEILWKHKIITTENYYYFRYVLSVALQMRFLAHGKNQREDDSLQYPNHNNSDRFILTKDLLNLVTECYRILLPLHRFAVHFYKKQGKENLFAKDLCYDKNTPWTEPQVYERMGDLEEAGKLYTQALQANQNSLELRCYYVNFLFLQRQYLFTVQHKTNEEQKNKRVKQIQQEHEENQINQTNDIETQLQYLAETLAKTSKAKEVYLSVYEKLTQPAKLELVAKLVLLSRENGREFLAPIIQHLLAVNDEENKSDAWKEQQRQWRKQLLCMVEQISEEEAKKRVRISSVLFPAHEYWVLKQAVVEKMLDDNGDFKTQNKYQGNHNVYRIQEQDCDIFAKPWPEMPGMTYLVEQLHRLIFGHGTSFSELIQLQLPNGKAVPVSVSQTIEGKTLEEALKEDPKIIEQLDEENFFEVFIVSLLYRPGDGIPSNFILKKLENGKYGLVSVDHDHGLFEPWGTKEKQRVLQLKSILWCLPQMLNKIPKTVMERFLSLAPKVVIETWLREAQVQNNCYQQFGEDNINKWHKSSAQWQNGKVSGTSTVAIPIKEGDANKLLQTWLLIRRAFEQHVNTNDLTGEQLFSLIYPSVAREYKEAKQISKDDPIECLARIGKYPRNKEGGLVSIHSALGTLTIKTDNGKEILCPLKNLMEPGQALLALETQHVQEQFLHIVQSALQQGQLAAYKELLLAEHQQRVLFGDGTLQWKPIDWNKLPKLIQKGLLALMEKQAFFRIDFPDCSNIPIESLIKIICNSPDLQVLRLGNCPQLTAKHLAQIIERCPCLTELALVDMDGLKGEISIGLKDMTSLKLKTTAMAKLNLEVPVLKYLRCVSNSELVCINNLPVSIRHIDVSSCKELTSVHCADINACNNLTKFIIEGTEKLPYFKEFNEDPKLLLAFLAEYEKIPPLIVKHLESHQSSMTFSERLSDVRIRLSSFINLASCFSLESDEELSGTDIEQLVKALKNNESEDYDNFIKYSAIKKLRRFNVMTDEVKEALLDILEKIGFQSTDEKMEAFALKDKNQSRSLEYIMGLIRGETEQVTVHIQALRKGAHKYNTPQLIIASIQTRFKRLDSIIEQLVLFLNEQLKTLVIEYIEEKFNKFIEVIKSHRTNIRAGAKVLRETSVEQKYQFCDRLYTSELRLYSLVGQLKNFIEADEVSKTLLPQLKGKLKQDNLKDSLAHYLSVIQFLPRQARSTLQGMELGQQIAKKQQIEISQTEICDIDPLIDDIDLLVAASEHLCFTGIYHKGDKFVSHLEYLAELWQKQQDTLSEEGKDILSRNIDSINLALNLTGASYPLREPQFRLAEEVIASMEVLNKKSSSEELKVLWKAFLTVLSYGFSWHALRLLEKEKETKLSLNREYFNCNIAEHMQRDGNLEDLSKLALTELAQQLLQNDLLKNPLVLNIKEFTEKEKSKLPMGIAFKTILKHLFCVDPEANMTVAEILKSGEELISTLQRLEEFFKNQPLIVSPPIEETPETPETPQEPIEQGTANTNNKKDEDGTEPLPLQNNPKKPNIITPNPTKLSDLLDFTFLSHKKLFIAEDIKIFSGQLQHNNEIIKISLRLESTDGKGDCAILASPFKDREELCQLLLRAINVPQNRVKLCDEIREALMNEKFLREEDLKIWQKFQDDQNLYHQAHALYQEKFKHIKLMLSEKSITVEDNDLVDFLENSKEYVNEFKQLSELDLLCYQQRQVFDKIEIKRMKFLSSTSVCEAYFKNVIALEGKWIGKGCLFLAAQQKGINLCIWKEQENSNVLLLDEDYSYLGNPSPAFNHVVYRLGSIHYDLMSENSVELVKEIVFN